MRLRICLYLCVALLASTSTVRTADKAIHLRDWTKRGFTTDLVRYRLSPELADKTLHVIDSDKKPIPHQVIDGSNGERLLLFVTNLPAGDNRTFTVSDRGGDSPDGSVVMQAGKNPDSLILGNSHYSVRVPSPQKQSFDVPTALSSLPAPVLGFKSGNSDWLGNGRFLSPLKATGLEIKLPNKGSVFTEILYRLDMENDAYYEARMQVIHDVPVLKIFETYFTPEKRGQDFWELDLTHGWTPTHCEMASVNRNGAPDRGRISPVKAIGQTPDPLTSPWTINPDNAWGNRSFLGLMNEDRSIHVGMVPLHKGWWRRYNAVQIQSPQPTGESISLRFPISVRDASWLFDTTSEQSPFSTQNHDPALPPTLGRRAWGLMLGSIPETLKIGTRHTIAGPFGNARMFLSCPSLDTYKDWQLDWQQHDVKYPRVFLPQDQLEAFRNNLAESELAEYQKHFYLVSGNEEDAKQNLKALQEQLDRWIAYITSTSNPGHGNGGVNVIALAEDVLAWPGLPETTRREIRSKLALCVYMTIEPDIMAWHAGTHMGNPNMPTGAYGMMPVYAAMLPDHPAYNEWIDWMSRWTAYGIGKSTAVGGGYCEYGTYGLHGYKNLYRGLMGLYAAGAGNADQLTVYNSSYWDYTIHALTPVDVRYKTRIMPGDANSHPEHPAEFIEAIATLAERAPDLASHVKWAWTVSGKNRWDLNPKKPEDGPAAEHVQPLLAWPQVKADKPDLRSRLVPAVGAFLRAHQGPDETYMYFRSGYAWSHWNVNQSHFVIHSKGNVIVPGQPYQYYGRNRAKEKGTPGFASYHDNVIRFGHPENEYDYGWPDSNIVQSTFSGSIDYLHASAGYPDWYVKPGRDPKWQGGEAKVKLADGVEQTPGRFTADRQVLFMKGKTGTSPNYFVFRDTVNGPGKLAQWWNMNLLGRKEHVRQEENILHVTGPFSTGMDIIFTGKTPLTLEMAEEEPATTVAMGYVGSTFGDVYNPGDTLPSIWVDEDGNPVGQVPEKKLKRPYEQHVLLRMAGDPGRDFYYVLYPLAAGEKAPVVTRLDDAVLKITHREGTDYVLVSPRHTTWSGESITMSGCVAAVRKNDAGVTAAILAGTGEASSQGTGVRGAAPAVESFASGTKTVKDIPAQTHVITLSPAFAGHTEKAPGVRVASADGATEYLVNGETPVTFADDTVRILARQAQVTIKPDATRIVVTDTQYVEITAGREAVRGCGPFDLTFKKDSIIGTVDGRMRTLVTSTPETVGRAMYWMDGALYQSGIPDEPSPFRETDTPQFSFAFGVAEGEHAVKVAAWTAPGVPPAAPVQMIQ